MTTDLVTFVTQAVTAADTQSLPNLPAEIIVTSFAEAKRVTKPWGFELWLSDGTKTPYAFKLLYLQAGAKTSLQYHNQKSEHNCVLSGTINFYYEDVTTKQIVAKQVSAGHVIAVQPPAIHRVEAVTDVVLMEASTNHLDDVVRLQDDYQRPDGRIATEHQPL